MTLPETYQSSLEYIQTSPKFQHSAPSEARQAVPFPGYTIITPPGEEDPENIHCYKTMLECQQELLQQVEPGLIVPLPPDSLHITLADLIWDTSYRDAAQNPNFEKQLQGTVEQIFQQYQTEISRGQPIRWQVLGLIVMTRAIAVCLAPRDEFSYETIVNFRRSLYQNPGLIALGIEQQYHLTAHVTLGYFGDIPHTLHRYQLSTTFYDLNKRWQDTPQEFLIERVELRKFDDMTRYYREDNWPVLKF